MIAGTNITVVEGKDDWLFLGRSGSSALIENAQDLTYWRANLLPKHVATYVGRHRRVVERNIPFIVVFAPEASGIYSECLPENISIEVPTACEILASELRHQGVQVVCPSQRFRLSKTPVDLYERHDSHWSSWGAYLCYRMIMDALGAPFAPATVAWDAIKFHYRQGYGDLGVHAVPERKGSQQSIEIPTYSVDPGINVFDVRERNIRHAKCPRGFGRALVFRDSFANALSPFLERTFAETILVGPAPVMLDGLIDEFCPDVVILQVAERALFSEEDPLSDWSARTFEQEFLEVASNPASGRLQLAASNAIISGKPQEAITLAAVAMVKEGSTHRAHNLAWALHSAHDYKTCYDLISDIPASKRNRFLYYLQADSAYSLGRLQDAHSAIDAALAFQPRNAMYLFLKGEFLFQMGDVAAAADTLSAAVNYAPLYKRAWYRYLEALAVSGREEEVARTRSRTRHIFGEAF